MSRKPTLLGLAVAVAVVTGAFASSASAYVAAQVDQAIRPNFGVLLKPPMDSRHRHRGVWRGRGRGWDGYNEPYGRPYGQPRGPSPYGPGGQPSITVDCNDPGLGPTPISDAAQYVADGGVVYVRAHGMACRETLEIDHPVVIAAEETSAFSVDPDPPSVVIAPPDGQPCVLVAQGVRQVELRGLVFDAGHSGPSSCIQSWDTEVALVRVNVDYAGDDSAIYVSGGRLILRESRINAHTYDAAVTTENAGLQMRRVRVRADAFGLDVTVGPEENSISDVGVLDFRGGGPGSVGVMVRAERSGGGLLRIKNSVICGFRVGVGVERAARAEVTRTRICRTSFGVNVDGGDFGISESAIGADHIGVYVQAGQGRVSHNRIYDLDNPYDAIVGETGAGVVDDTNWLYLKSGCDKFNWDGRHFCKPGAQVPAALRDEKDFDRDYLDAWEVDGYDQGYTRDGVVGPFDKPKPPKPPKRRFSLFGSGHRASPPPPPPSGPVGPPPGSGFGPPHP